MFGWIVLTAALAQLGQVDEAAAGLAEFKLIRPELSASILDRYPFRLDADRQHYKDALAKGGSHGLREERRLAAKVVGYSHLIGRPTARRACRNERSR